MDASIPARVRLMRRADLPCADALRAVAGWNQTIGDWARFLQAEPEGCFVAEWNGELVGTVTTTCYGPTLGWIGMMLVHPERRRLGIGSRLLERAIGQLQQRGVRCVKLDATPQGQPMYEQFGFVPETALGRWESPGPSCSPGSLPAQPSGPATNGWKDILDLDARAFGIARPQHLGRLASQSLLALECRDSASKLGFGMLRDGSRATYLGPVIASSAEIGRETVHHLLSGHTPRLVYWDVLEANSAARALATELGFRMQRPLLRMRLGPGVLQPALELQYAVADPATG